MELREIAAFIQVAQLKSFSKAAKQLGYSQAAVTIQIKQLEQELNVHLFDRIGKQTTLTHQGALFYEHAVSVMKELEHARDAVTHVSELTGSLCLGTIESICATIFPELLREYHRLYPKVNVRLITDSPETLLEMMNSNAIDIVFHCFISISTFLPVLVFLHVLAFMLLHGRAQDRRWNLLWVLYSAMQAERFRPHVESIYKASRLP